jgi:hypothetical protein
MNDDLMALMVFPFIFGFIFIFWAIIPTYFPVLLRKIFRDPSISGFGRKLAVGEGSLEKETMVMRVKGFNFAP